MDTTHTTNVHVHGAAQQPWPIGTMHDKRIGSVPFFWCLLFGAFYLAYKGLWFHAFVYILLSWTFIVPLIYCFKARGLIYSSMKARGLLN